MAPKTIKALTFIFRPRAVLSEGFEIRIPVILPVVQFWISCQHMAGLLGGLDGRLTIAQCTFRKFGSQKNR